MRPTGVHYTTYMKGRPSVQQIHDDIEATVSKGARVGDAIQQVAPQLMEFYRYLHAICYHGAQELGKTRNIACNAVDEAPTSAPFLTLARILHRLKVDDARACFQYQNLRWFFAVIDPIRPRVAHAAQQAQNGSLEAPKIPVIPLAHDQLIVLSDQAQKWYGDMLDLMRFLLTDKIDSTIRMARVKVREMKDLRSCLSNGEITAWKAKSMEVRVKEISDMMQQVMDDDSSNEAQTRYSIESNTFDERMTKMRAYILLDSIDGFLKHWEKFESTAKILRESME